MLNLHICDILSNDLFLFCADLENRGLEAYWMLFVGIWQFVHVWEANVDHKSQGEGFQETVCKLCGRQIAYDC